MNINISPCILYLGVYFKALNFTNNTVKDKLFQRFITIDCLITITAVINLKIKVVTHNIFILNIKILLLSKLNLN